MGKRIHRCPARPMRAISVVVSLMLAATASYTSSANAPETAPATLDAADIKMLDKLFVDGLFDPAGHRFVKFTLPMRNVWYGMEKREVSGWLAEPKDKTFGDGVAWAVLVNGEAVPVTGATAPGDFVGECRKAIDQAVAIEARKRQAATKPSTKAAADRDDDFAEMDKRMSAISQEGFQSLNVEPAPFLAAWLHRLGNDALAGPMLRLAKSGPNSIEEASDGNPAGVPLQMRPWHWYSRAVHAYMARADAESLFYARALAHYFPKAMKEPAKDEKNAIHYPQATLLLAELERRRKEGTFDTPAPAIPKDFSTWPIDRRVTWLIQQLQEVDARQMGQPGGIDLAGDSRVAALIDIGDPAVPALIDCIESDARLTRSVHFWRDFSDDRTPLGVREAALTAVMSILRTNVFSPRSTGDNFTSRGQAKAKSTAQVLREYWKTYGHLTLDARMMKILTDATATSEAWREAAENLANFGEKRTLGTTVWAGGAGGREPGALNPVIGRFKNPTVAEAILTAMDRDLARHDGGKHDDLYDYHRRQIESQYVDALIALHDASIVPDLLKRLGNRPGVRMRRLWSTACFELGDAGPLALYCEDVRAGRLTLPPGGNPKLNANDQQDAEELKSIIHTLSFASSRLPAADAALFAIAGPQHPWHALAAASVLEASGFDGQVWLTHPFALEILRAELDNVRSSGETWFIQGDKSGQWSLQHKYPNGSGGGSVPEPLRDPKVRRDRVESRVCDERATKASEMILGVPYYHALLNDADQRLSGLKSFLDAHTRHLRRATYAETSALDASSFEVRYILNIRRLASGATAQDVANGQALFHFDGKGTPLELKLPAQATLKRDLPPGREPTEDDVAADRARHVWQPDPKDENKGRQILRWEIPHVLILQAERAPDGKIWYGIVSRYEMRKVAEEELTEVKPLQN